MPKYLDYHAIAPKLSPEVVKAAVNAAKAGEVDRFGVKEINAFFTDRGEAYCLTEAPSALAVCKSHEAMGMELGIGDVREVNTLV